MSMFFVLGSPRSGTTLMQAMLMARGDTAIPPETQYFPIAKRFAAYEGGDLPNPKRWEFLLKKIRWHCKGTNTPMDWQWFDKQVATGPYSHHRLFSLWLEAVRRVEGLPHIGEKSPAHTEYAVQIAAMFEEARFILITRDPRDVAASRLTSWNDPVLASAIRWRKDQQCLAEFEQLVHPDRWLRVHYEDFVSDVEATARSVSAALGIRYLKAMNTPHIRKNTGITEKWKHVERTLKPITRSRIGVYKNTLSDGEISLVEEICGAQMARLGYKTSAPRRLSTAKAVWDGVFPVLKTHINRRIKAYRSTR